MGSSITCDPPYPDTVTIPYPLQFEQVQSIDIGKEAQGRREGRGQSRQEVSTPPPTIPPPNEDRTPAMPPPAPIPAITVSSYRAEILWHHYRVHSNKSIRNVAPTAQEKIDRRKCADRATSFVASIQLSIGIFSIVNLPLSLTDFNTVPLPYTPPHRTPTVSLLYPYRSLLLAAPAAAVAARRAAAAVERKPARRERRAERRTVEEEAAEIEARYCRRGRVDVL